MLIHTNIMELGTGYTNKGRHNFIILTIYPLRKPRVGRYVVFVRLPTTSIPWGVCSDGTGIDDS